MGTSHLNRNVAPMAPAICATMKPATSPGLMPANVSLKQRAIVTAGFANDVEAVNQYAEAMYNPTANGIIPEREREQPQITDKRPKVAINSLNNCALPLRACCEKEMMGSLNIRWATIVPQIAPMHCATM